MAELDVVPESGERLDATRALPVPVCANTLPSDLMPTLRRVASGEELAPADEHQFYAALHAFSAAPAPRPVEAHRSRRWWARLRRPAAVCHAEA